MHPALNGLVPLLTSSNAPNNLRFRKERISRKVSQTQRVAGNGHRKSTGRFGVALVTTTGLVRLHDEILIGIAMCYMMSKEQYINDEGHSWHPPPVMFYAAGDAAKSWGANLQGSPVMAANDPHARLTTFFVVVHQWSDGTPGPPMEHRPATFPGVFKLPKQDSMKDTNRSA
jgi:hypothetical protein